MFGLKRQIYSVCPSDAKFLFKSHYLRSTSVVCRHLIYNIPYLVIFVVIRQSLIV